MKSKLHLYYMSSYSHRVRIALKFKAHEELLKCHAGTYTTGDEVFLADLFLAPQIHAVINPFGLDMTQYPLLSRLNEAYSLIPCFQDSVPEKQSDAPITT